MNLKAKTKQEIFDFVVNHLLTQNKKSGEDNDYYTVCKYRYDGLTCAAGCLIDEKDYNESFEGLPWNTVVEKLPKKYDNHILLISDLQAIHDGCFVEEWEDQLKILAKERNLVFKNT